MSAPRRPGQGRPRPPPNRRATAELRRRPRASCRPVCRAGFHRVDRCLDDAFSLTLAADGSSATWAACDFNTTTKLPPRAQHAGALLAGGNYGYIFGGYDGTKNLQDLLLFCMDAHGTPVLRDVACGPAPEARCRHSTHAIGNALLVLGGYNGTLPYAPDVYTLDVEDASATLAKLMQAPSPNRRGSSLGRRSSSNNMTKEDAPATGTE